MPPPQASAPEPEPRPEAVGDITRALFEAQADGRRAARCPCWGRCPPRPGTGIWRVFPIPFPSGSRSGWKPRTPINQHAFRAPRAGARDARVPVGTPVFVSMRSREHVNPLDPLRSSLAAARQHDRRRRVRGAGGPGAAGRGAAGLWLLHEARGPEGRGSGRAVGRAGAGHGRRGGLQPRQGGGRVGGAGQSAEYPGHLFRGRRDRGLQTVGSDAPAGRRHAAVRSGQRPAAQCDARAYRQDAGQCHSQRLRRRRHRRVGAGGGDQHAAGGSLHGRIAAAAAGKGRSPVQDPGLGGRHAAAAGRARRGRPATVNITPSGLLDALGLPLSVATGVARPPSWRRSAT